MFEVLPGIFFNLTESCESAVSQLQEWQEFLLVSCLILLCGMEGNNIASSNQDVIELSLNYEVSHFNLYFFFRKVLVYYHFLYPSLRTS